MRALACVVFSLAIGGCWSESHPAAVQPQPQPAQPKQVVVADIVQPVTVTREPDGGDGDSDADEGEPEGDPNGVEGGEEGGVVGGVVGGVGYSGAPPPPPPPPPPAPPMNVAPQMLETSRVGGEKLIVPDDPTKVEIARSGRDKIIASFKLCLDRTGAISKVTTLRGSGFAKYDAKITSTIQNSWRYRPYLVNQKPTEVCTAVTFIYSQSAPPPPPPHS